MSEELKPLYADVHDIDKLVQQMSDSSANVVYNLHEDILCLREQLAKERSIRESYALVPVESLQRAAEWFTESQGWNWLEYEDKPLDIDEMLQCVEELKKFKAMIAAAQESEE